VYYRVSNFEDCWWLLNILVHGLRYSWDISLPILRGLVTYRLIVSLGGYIFVTWGSYVCDFSIFICGLGRVPYKYTSLSVLRSVVTYRLTVILGRCDFVS